MSFKVKRPDYADKLEHFMEELLLLCEKYGYYIGGCGCCGSPWITDDKNNTIGEYLNVDKEKISCGADGYDLTVNRNDVFSRLDNEEKTNE